MINNAELPIDKNEYLVSFGEEDIYIVAKNYSQARYLAFKKAGLNEFMTYEEFIFNKPYLKVRKIKKATLSSLFYSEASLDYCKNYRNMKFLNLGMKAMWNNQIVYVIGGSDILIFYNPSDQSVFPAHPKYNIKYFDNQDHIIAEYPCDTSTVISRKLLQFKE